MVSRFVIASVAVHVLAAVGVTGMHRVQSKNATIIVEITKKSVEVKMPERPVPAMPPRVVEKPKPVAPPPEVPPPTNTAAEAVAPPVAPEVAPAPVPVPTPIARPRLAARAAARPSPSTGSSSDEGGGGGGGGGSFGGGGSGSYGGGGGGGGGSSGAGSIGVEMRNGDVALVPGSAAHASLQQALATLFGARSGGDGSGSGAGGGGGGGGGAGPAGKRSKQASGPPPLPPQPPPPNSKECGGVVTDLNFSDTNCGECDKKCRPGKSCVLGVCIGGVQFVMKKPTVLPSDMVGIPMEGGGRKNGLLDIIRALNDMNSSGAPFVLEEVLDSMIESESSNTLLDFPFDDPSSPVSIFMGASKAKVDVGTPPTQMRGSLDKQRGFFEFNVLAGNSAPVLQFVIKQGGASLVLPITVHFFRIEFQDPDQYGDPQRLTGELQGSMYVGKLLEPESPFIRDTARYLDYVANDPKAKPEDRKALTTLFDEFGPIKSCTNPDGTVAVHGDGHIAPCEVSAKAVLFTDYFKPDIHVVNNAGAFMGMLLDQKDPKKWESKSFGIRFEGIRQQFAR